MITISTLTASPARFVQFDESPDSTLDGGDPRVTRVKTLDGGASTIHSGYTDQDRTLSIRATIDQDTRDTLVAIRDNESFIRVSFYDGVFQGVISGFNADNGQLRMTVLISSDREDG